MQIVYTFAQELTMFNGYKYNKKEHMETNKEIKKVSLKYGTRYKLAKLFKVSVTTITLAVTGRTNSDLARKIRIAAVEMGGYPIYNI